MRKKKDHYRTLGVHFDATFDEIKNAYRKTAVQYHPDKNPGDKQSEEKFKALSEAYTILSNPDQRRIYDQAEGICSDLNYTTSNRKTNEHSTTDLNDIFNDILQPQKAKSQTNRYTNSYKNRHQKVNPTKNVKNIRTKGQRGSDINIELAISFAQSILGVEKSIQLKRNETCKTCDGTGTSENSIQSICPRCMGKGQTSQSQGKMRSAQFCNRCDGKGTLIHQPCGDCHGVGVVRKERTLRVKVPPLTDDGSLLRLANKGHTGENRGDSGNLFVKVLVEKHPVLERDGYDLKCRIPIGFATAALGGKIEVPTLTGHAKFEIPGGTQPNKTFRINNLGIKKGEDEKGDLAVTVEIRVPTKLSKKQQKLLKDYKKTEPEYEFSGKN